MCPEKITVIWCASTLTLCRAAQKHAGYGDAAAADKHDAKNHIYDKHVPLQLSGDRVHVDALKGSNGLEAGLHRGLEQTALLYTERI